MGCIYALVALGYVFIWNAMAIINFAQGEFLMFAAFIYVATFSIGLHFGFGVSLLLTGAAMGILGAFFSRVVYSRLRHQPTLVAIIATVAMGLFLKEAARLIYGPEPFYYAGPLGTRMVPVLGWAIPAQQLIIVGVALGVMLVQQVLFHRSLAGEVIGVVAELIRGDVSSWGPLMAGALLASIPVVIAYGFLMDYYVSGLVAGATKY